MGAGWAFTTDKLCIYIYIYTSCNCVISTCGACIRYRLKALILLREESCTTCGRWWNGATKSGATKSYWIRFSLARRRLHLLLDSFLFPARRATKTHCKNHWKTNAEARCCACRVKKVYLEGFLFNVSKGVIPSTPYPILLISSIWRSPWEKHPKHLQPVQMSMPAQRASKFCATRCAVLPEVFSFIVQFPASRTTL